MKKSLLTLMALFVTAFCYSQDTLVYTGSVQKYVVPPCVDSVVIQVYGAAGSNSNNDGRATSSKASKGSYAKGTMHVIYGDTLYVYVGGSGDTTLGAGGWNGGGTGGYGSPGGSCDPGYGGGGGGASDVRYNDTSHASRVIVAGGGGGAGRDYCNGTCQPCGCGGSGGGVGADGFKGDAANNCGFGYPGGDSNAGYGGTQFAPGKGGSGDNTNVNVGMPGFNWMGGKGSDGYEDVAGGGGGGGYYGGGGGGGAYNGSGVGGGGGGGGSSYIGSVVNGVVIDSIRSGNGLAIITPIGGVMLTTTATAAKCYGSNTGTAAVTVSCGTAPFMYNWSPSGGTNDTASGLSAGTYIVTVTDKNGLTGHDTVVITQPGALVDSIHAMMDSICTGNCDSLSAKATGGTPGYTYMWNTGATSANINVCPTSTTTYGYRVTDANGCSSTDSVTVKVDACTGIKEVKGLAGEVNIYPNPFSQTLTVELNASEKVEATMYDMLGNEVGTWQLKKGLNELNTQTIPKGVYSLQLKSAGGILTREFVKVN